MKKYVYIVESGSKYGGKEVEGVFSSLNKAKRCAKKYAKKYLFGCKAGISNGSLCWHNVSTYDYAIINKYEIDGKYNL